MIINTLLKIIRLFWYENLNFLSDSAGILLLSRNSVKIYSVIFCKNKGINWKNVQTIKTDKYYGVQLSTRVFSISTRFFTICNTSLRSDRRYEISLMQCNSNLFVCSFLSTEGKRQTCMFSRQRFETPFQNARDKNRNGVGDICKFRND